MNPILEQICRIGIIPVIAIDDAKKAVPLARSLVEGGLPSAPVPPRRPCGRLRLRCPRCFWVRVPF